ncbi:MULTISPECIES: hypothetical protein [unclassified Pseudonocardia]|uniref:hypothetical protein n=1 Tax=unclassified Pseudonocardia TaxID=2619320 RepID=UPI0009696D5C|nr:MULTISPECIES: hypothetical protein [unclassified Pseudonocardia]OLL70809.1 hypothetical protein Ae263Ps1_6223c [Pseudonocardia sp. Ae263_Ps1]
MIGWEGRRDYSDAAIRCRNRCLGHDLVVVAGLGNADTADGDILERKTGQYRHRG